ncbi:NmrA family transcriptional regulator [Rhodococcus sp. NCIMB 12038]|uniref:NmrA family transcriptional regulator n=1 Tax=Rhodococcus sp. NCIMB 12038 TaxID=933800 RepID=UPI000B3C8F72|nr:NmrA family transcriptional regulator [Rhodococcus sp. NCIMB 12038]OUS90581.1 NmrA family transcriptional regulator [Rhodococcus sp. NCIMB 12038]
MTTTPHTLVLTATGKVGSRVLAGLTAAGVPARGGSRSGTPPFDWDNRDTWRPALDGITSVYIAYYPDLAAPGAAEVVEEFAGLAVANGARRLVLLSGRGETEAERGELAIRKAGAEWTILRSSWFGQNFGESFMLDSPLAGELYELTGPRLLSFGDAVAEIAEATGREIRYTPVTSKEYSTALAGQGVPSDAIGLLTYLFDEVLDGRNASLTDGVERALGRAPRDFTDYVRAAAAAGVWRV